MLPMTPKQPYHHPLNPTEDTTLRNATVVALSKFRKFLSKKGYKFDIISLPYGALPPNRNKLNQIFIIKNPDNALKSLLSRYEIDYNHRRNYFYRNEWTDSSQSIELNIHITSYSDIYKILMLICKEV